MPMLLAFRYFDDGVLGLQVEGVIRSDFAEEDVVVDGGEIRCEGTELRAACGLNDFWHGGFFAAMPFLRYGCRNSIKSGANKLQCFT